MKMQEVVEVKVYTSLTLAPDGDEWSSSAPTTLPWWNRKQAGLTQDGKEQNDHNCENWYNLNGTDSKEKQ
jgi:hypothetical protein